MTEDEEKQYRKVHQETVNGMFLRASIIAGEAVKKGVKYKVACEAIYAAHYQAVFGSALKKLQNDGKVATGLTMNEAWATRAVHELVAHEVMMKALYYLDALDDRYVWAMNIMKKEKPRKP